jgi:hypothetical protein
MLQFALICQFKFKYDQQCVLLARIQDFGGGIDMVGVLLFEVASM